jgi:YidC/Oxa1 family membrane protein insertase
MDFDFKRLFAAFVLCMLIMFGWQKVMEKKYGRGPAQETSPTTSSVSPAAKEQSLVQTTKAAGSVAEASEGGAWHLEKTERHDEVVVLGDLDSYKNAGYKAQISLDSVSGSIQEVLLSEYKFKVTDKDTGYPLLCMAQNRDGDIRGSLMLRSLKFVGRAEEFDLSGGCWKKISAKPDPADNEQSVSYQAVILDEAGQPVFEIVKIYRYKRDDYQLDFSLRLANKSGGALEVEWLKMLGPVGVSREDPRTDRRNAVVAYADSTGEVKVVHSDRNSIETKPEKRLLAIPDGSVRWFAVANKFFASVVRPLPEGKSGKVDCILRDGVRAELLTCPPGAADDKKNKTVATEATLGKGRTVEVAAELKFDFKVYLGPIDKGIFDNPKYAGAELHYEHLMYRPSCAWCSFNWLTFALLKMMEVGFKLTGNYGVVIIILVLLVRLILHPISKKSQVNMMKMGKMGPKIEEIKQKYAGNKEEIQKQTMAIYKQQGATPILGCLPMLLQMPIWIALFTAVDSNVALRHQGLLPASWHWLTDLSAPDRLIPFSLFGVSGPIEIPVIGSMMGGIDAFNLLPILLCIAMFLQTKFSPQASMSAANPQAAQQQKMMMYMMPVMMLVFFYTAPSGLNLYIMASTFGGLIEQKFIRKHLREQEEREAAGVVESGIKVSGRFGPKKKKPKPPIKFN